MTCAGLAAVPAAAQAQAAAAESNWSLGLLMGEGVNSNLLEILPDAVRGRLDFPGAHIGGLVIRRKIPAPAWLVNWGATHDIPVSTSVEASVLKASGLATNGELALDWRPSITPWHVGSVGFEIGWGIGVSQAFGKPWSDYTDPAKPDGYRTLFHMAPEIALRDAKLPDWSLALRIHHRSGIYGVVGPRRVGSNHLSVVVMHDF